MPRAFGVSHTAPQRHFPDGLPALLAAPAETGFARLDTALRTALAGAGDYFPSRVHATMTTYTRFATDNAALLELMFTCRHRTEATPAAEVAKAPFKLMSGLILQGQAQGDLQAGDPERVGVVLVATLQCGRRRPAPTA
ncbi:hypothetical protein [Embleya sp. NPDC059237]|uniref:hypothetical protein n=1 Tax=Embleya sp. NPDC059237 TaxID=3346784 RepID=UPI0036757AEA